MLRERTRTTQHIQSDLVSPSRKDFAQTLPGTEQTHLAKHNRKYTTHLGYSLPAVIGSRQCRFLPVRDFECQRLAAKPTANSVKRCGGVHSVWGLPAAAPRPHHPLPARNIVTTPEQRKRPVLPVFERARWHCRFFVILQRLLLPLKASKLLLHMIELLLQPLLLQLRLVRAAHLKLHLLLQIRILLLQALCSCLCSCGLRFDRAEVPEQRRKFLTDRRV
jgi:hypothetical protein